MNWLPSVATNLAVTASDPGVWPVIGLGLLLGVLCFFFGTWVARLVGLLRPNAAAADTFGVGLASGLVVLTPLWAAIWSGGRSSFTPVAAGFAVALALAGVSWVYSRVRKGSRTQDCARASCPAGDINVPATGTPGAQLRTNLRTALLAAAFVVVVALLYGATMAPSPRNGAQPVEFPDQALYAVLGQQLAATGTETTVAASGFADLPDAPSQGWYHWGELWLAAGVITVFGIGPVPTRFFVVLPLLLLAAASLTGSLVQRLGRTDSPWAYVFGFLACLFLMPVSLAPSGFSFAAVGMLSGISVYGLGSVALLLALVALIGLDKRPASWSLMTFVASVVALILPAHIVIATLAIVGAGVALTLRLVRSLLAAHHLPTVVPVWQRVLAVAAVLLVATTAWGFLTGHGIAESAVEPTVVPFNSVWFHSVALETLGLGVLWMIPVAWIWARQDEPLLESVYVGTIAILVCGAVVWGARLADFNMLYFFFGAIALFVVPVGAVAIWSVWLRLRRAGHVRFALGLAVLCGLQLEWGVVATGLRLAAYGPRGYPSIPVEMLAAIKQLPSGAELAYACQPFEEASSLEPQLLSIDAHTGHLVVPMCYQADVDGQLLGAPRSPQRASLSFQMAPQLTLYPNDSARPSSATVESFLRSNGIQYIYADALHPNSLVKDTIVLARYGDFEVLKLP